MPGLELDDILMGVSVCRNQNLANVFYCLQLASQKGSITRIDAEKALSVSSSTASRLLRKMVKQGLLLQTGNTKLTKYLLS